MEGGSFFPEAATIMPVLHLKAGNTQTNQHCFTIFQTEQALLTKRIQLIVLKTHPAGKASCEGKPKKPNL